MDGVGDEIDNLKDKKPSKRIRNAVTAAQLQELTRILALGNYPSTEVREAAALKLGMTARKVQIWFQNQRQLQKRTREVTGSSSTNTSDSQSLRGSSASPNSPNPSILPLPPNSRNSSFSSSPPFHSPLLPPTQSFWAQEGQSYEFNVRDGHARSNSSDSGLSRQRSSSSGSGIRRMEDYSYSELPPIPSPPAIPITLPPLASVLDDLDTPRSNISPISYSPPLSRQIYQEPVYAPASIFNPQRKRALSFLPRFSRLLSSNSTSSSSTPSGPLQPIESGSNAILNAALATNRPQYFRSRSSNDNMTNSSRDPSMAFGFDTLSGPRRSFDSSRRPSTSSSIATSIFPLRVSTSFNSSSSNIAAIQSNTLAPIRRNEIFSSRTLPSIGASLEAGFGSFQADWEMDTRAREDGNVKRTR